MTTNTPNQTLTFPFGETPEDVIRERLEAFDVEREVAFAEGFADPEQKGWLYAVRLIHAHRDNPDDLLTVLDALAIAPIDADDPDVFTELRISILAALGINEGGE